jgi:hypothetical protein
MCFESSLVACGVIVDNDVSGAVENMIALCALLSSCLPDESM